MLATLMALAVAEHWFLVAPLNANALWGPLSRRAPGELAALLDGEFAALDPDAGGAVAIPPTRNPRIGARRCRLSCDARRTSRMCWSLSPPGPLAKSRRSKARCARSAQTGSPSKSLAVGLG